MPRPICTVLEEVMTQRDMSIPDIARACNLSDSTVRAIIARKSKSVALEVAAKLSVGLGVSLEYLNGEKERDDPKENSTTPTPAGQRIGRAYDRADPPVKKIVDVTLEPYMEDVPPLGSPVAPDAEPNLIPLFWFPASAGRGVHLEDEDYDMIEAGDEVPPAADFGIRIAGDSMEPRYHSGQIAWIKRMDAIDVGQIGVFVVNGEGYIKKQGRGALISLNPKYDPIDLEEHDDVRTVGLVIGVSEGSSDAPEMSMAARGGHGGFEPLADAEQRARIARQLQQAKDGKIKKQMLP